MIRRIRSNEGEMRNKRKAAAAVLQTTVGNMTRNYLATAGRREQENTAGPVAHSFGILREFHGRVLASEHGNSGLLWVRGRGCPCYLAGLASERKEGVKLPTVLPSHHRKSYPHPRSRHQTKLGLVRCEHTTVPSVKSPLNI